MFLKTKILSIVAIGLVFVGCGDETYNCQNEKFAKEAYFNAYSHIAETQQSEFKYLTDLANIEISLIKIDDKEKTSICRAKLEWDIDLNNERVAESFKKLVGERYLNQLTDKKYKGSEEITYEISDNGRGESMIRVKR
ncbi:hypothetical protein [Campylobacter majalis]|uniref:hypothetical protein n=1 Tax=Campylobacter majalis TaxID=2790656 RepID=UPI003D69DC3C